MQLKQSSKLAGVSYEIRGPVAEQAARLEAEGHHVVKLNTGSPLQFGFEAPAEILQDIVRALPASSGYCTSKGCCQPGARWCSTTRRSACWGSTWRRCFSATACPS